MWCLISQPNAIVFEVRVDPKAIGQECLEKVCEYLGISNEADYFGLKFENNKGEELWLNLRNPIDRQVNCHGHTSPVRLALRVKFWVPPHLLLQENTRHLFYLHARSDLLEKRLVPPDWATASRLIALVTQADAGDYDPLRPPHAAYLQASCVAPDGPPRPPDFLQTVAAQHGKCRNMRRATAEYWLLKEASELGDFGEEVFGGRQGGAALGVGPHGIAVREGEREKRVITFASIVSASSHRRCFKLEYLDHDGKEAVLEVKLDSSHAASGLYRAITEKHAFYSCETVRSAVTAQFIRDLKGTIASIFNEDSTLGKKYVFDIRRTCREVYDNARRALYQEKMQAVAAERHAAEHGGDTCKDSEERLNRLLDAVTCRICMDARIDCAFLPCAHVVACEQCAARVDRCPLCRAHISQAQKIYLPGELGQAC